MNALPGMEAPVPVEEVMSIAVGGGGTMRQPRPRNKMGRRPSWSEAEVLAAVMAILQHPEGTSRGPEAISVWHQQLRDTFMGRFRSLASTTPSLAAREDVWANRSARKIISEARNALNACRVLHRARAKTEAGLAGLDETHTGSAANGEFSYPAVYDWLLRSTRELNRNGPALIQVGGGVGGSVAVPEPTTMETDAIGTVAAVGVGDAEPAVSAVGVPSMAAAAAIAAVAAANPLPPVSRENGSRSRIKRPRTSTAPNTAPTHPAMAGGGNVDVSNAANVANVASVGNVASVANLGNIAGIGLDAPVAVPVGPEHQSKRKRQEVIDIETRRQMAELAALRDMFGPNCGAQPSEVEEFKRLVRRNALRRAAMDVLDVNEGTDTGGGTTADGLVPWEQVRGGRSSLSRLVG